MSRPSRVGESNGVGWLKELDHSIWKFHFCLYNRVVSNNLHFVYYTIVGWLPQFITLLQLYDSGTYIIPCETTLNNCRWTFTEAWISVLGGVSGPSASHPCTVRSPNTEKHTNPWLVALDVQSAGVWFSAVHHVSLGPRIRDPALIERVASWTTIVHCFMISDYNTRSTLSLDMFRIK